MGPSGCGKSTLLKVAAGLIPPDTGKVLLRGQDIFLLSERGIRELRKSNGFVFQDGALWENKTLFRESCPPPRGSFSGTLAHRHREARRARPGEGRPGGTAAGQRPAALSGGERKIASFLRALVTEPSLVFLDEPTLSIDFSMTEKITHMIHDLKARGTRSSP